MEILVFATLRDVIGRRAISVDHLPNSKLADLLNQAFAQYPELKPVVLDEKGVPRGHINIFVNGRDVRYLNGWDTAIDASDLIRIFPPVGGGK